jgi:hypothetical protein
VDTAVDFSSLQQFSDALLEQAYARHAAITLEQDFYRDVHWREDLDWRLATNHA